MIGREIRIPDAPDGGGIFYDRSSPSGFFGSGGSSTGRIVPPVPVVGLRVAGGGSVARAAPAPSGEPGSRVLCEAPDPRIASFDCNAEFRLRDPRS